MVTEDDIAEVLWGEKNLRNYSNWAISKMLSTLRQKLGDIKPFKLIKTIRNKGYILYNS